MANWLVIEDFVLDRYSFPAGTVLDDTGADLPLLVSSGLTVVEWTAALATSFGPARDAYLKYRRSWPVSGEPSSDLASMLVAFLVDAGSTAPVASVFGRIGAVTAAVSDYTAAQIDNTSGVTGAFVEDALDTLDADKASVTHAASHSQGGADEITVENLAAASLDTTLFLRPDGAGGLVFAVPPGDAVISVFGRTGDIVAAASDYDASQVDNDSGVAGVFVDDALNTLDSTKASTTHAATHSDGGSDEIVVDSLAAGSSNTTLRLAPDGAGGVTWAAGGGAPVASVFGRVGVVVAAASDYDASQIDNDSGVTGAFVDDALDNLDTAIGTNTTNLGNHTSDTANPHSTNIGNLGSGTLAELNAIITDATLDDDGEPRTPTAHSATHSDGGADQITVENLATGSADTSVFLRPDGVGGLVFGTPPPAASFVFDPLATPAGNVYDDFVLCVTAAAAAPGTPTVEVRGDATVTDEVDFPLDGIRLYGTGRTTPGRWGLTFAGTSTLTGPPASVEGLDFIYSGTGTLCTVGEFRIMRLSSGLTFQATAAGILFTADDAVFAVQQIDGTLSLTGDLSWRSEGTASVFFELQGEASVPSDWWAAPLATGGNVFVTTFAAQLGIAKTSATFQAGGGTYTVESAGAGQLNRPTITAATYTVGRECPAVYPVDSTSNAIEATLPATADTPTQEPTDAVTFYDHGGNCGTNALTIVSADTILGDATIDTDGGTVTLVPSNEEGTWVVIARTPSPAAPVDSVFGRTGAVSAAASDYDASQIDNDSGVTGAFVDDALNTLDSGKASTTHATTHSDGGSDEISVDDLAAASNDTALRLAPDGAGGVQWSAGGAAPVTSVFGRVGVVVAAVSDYDASQIDNDSGVTGAFVDDALNTLDSGKASTTHATTHSDGGSDEIEVEDLATASTNTALFLRPDGVGGLVFATPGGGGDVTGPGSATDNAFVRWDGASGTLTQNGVVLGDDLGNITGVESLFIDHTALADDDYALEILVDAAGNGDVKALDVAYITGNIALGVEEEAILVNIDEAAATAGRISALNVLSTDEGGATSVGYRAGPTVVPLFQDAGSFADADTILVLAVDQTTALSSGGAGNIAVFSNDNDTLTVANATMFEDIEFIFDTVASNPGIAPVFEHSTGIGTWAAFVPTDGTNQMRNNGVVSWEDDDIPSWATGTGGDYLIRVTRTRNTLGTTPILDLVQIAAVTNYQWDETGAVEASTLAVRATDGLFSGFQAGATVPAGFLTLPTAFAAVNGYVLSSTTGGVLSWVAQTTAAPVDSVFGRTGVVVAAASDYDASQIDNDSGVAGAFVDDALNTLDSGKASTAHATTHSDGGSDEIEVEALATSSTDTALRLAPDGAGGLQWSSGGGGGGEDLAATLAIDNITDGNDIVLSSGDAIATPAGSGAGAGGLLNLSAGAGGSTGVGGGITATAGAGGATSGAGGAVTFTSGAGGASASASGAVTIASGAPGATGESGAVILESSGGSATGASGALTIRTGTRSVSGDTGAILIETGSTQSGDTGSMTLRTSNSEGGDGGNFEIKAGDAGGQGSGGTILQLTGRGADSQDGGDWSVITERGGNDAGQGGDINFTSGEGRTSGTSGNFTITLGLAGPTGIGGAISGTAGTGGSTSGAGGALTWTAGAGANNGAGGVASVVGGAGHGTAAGGALNLDAGAAGATGDGGTTTITSGDGGATSGDAGDIVLDPGTGDTDGIIDCDGVVVLKSFTVAGVPAQNAGGLIYVSNEVGGATIAFSDGTNWRRAQDRAVVS